MHYSLIANQLKNICESEESYQKPQLHDKKDKNLYRELKKGNEQTNESKDERTELQTEKNKQTNKQSKQTSKEDTTQHNTMLFIRVIDV